MCELCERSYKLDKEHHTAIRNIVHRIIDKTQPSHISLFGSFARGEWHENSDLDLFIVAEERNRCAEWLREASEKNEFKLQIEAFVHTPEEYETMLDEMRPFITQVITEGIVVYEKPKKNKTPIKKHKKRR